MFWLYRISLASFSPEKYDFVQCTYVKSSRNSFLVEGTNSFYSTSIVFHIIGYNWFQFKLIILGFDQTLFECKYKLFLHSVVWGEIREYITRNLFSYLLKLVCVVDHTYRQTDIQTDTYLQLTLPRSMRFIHDLSKWYFITVNTVL